MLRIALIALIAATAGCTCDSVDPIVDSGVDGGPDAGPTDSGSEDGGGPPTWEVVGSQVSALDAESEDPAMLFVDGVPAVGYRHGSFSTVLRVWTGDRWGDAVADPTGGNTLSSLYRSPDFCFDQSAIFMSYGHAGDGTASDGLFYDRVLAHMWTSAAGYEALRSGAEISEPWDAGRDVGYNATEAAIACATGVRPVVGWIEVDDVAEEDSDVFVARADDAGHSPRINRVATLGTDARVVDVEVDQDGVVYVAHFEHSEDASSETDLFVTRWDGATLTNLGGAIDHDTNSNRLSAPSLVATRDQLYLAWSSDRDDSGSRHIRVAEWDGAAWAPMGDGPVTALGAAHVDSGNPDLMLGNGGLTVAWQEDSDEGAFIFVARWGGAAGFQVIGDRINVDPNRPALDPSLAEENGTTTLYVAFEEMVEGWPQIFVRRLPGVVVTR